MHPHKHTHTLKNTQTHMTWLRNIFIVWPFSFRRFVPSLSELAVCLCLFFECTQSYNKTCCTRVLDVLTRAESWSACCVCRPIAPGLMCRAPHSAKGANGAFSAYKIRSFVDRWGVHSRQALLDKQSELAAAQRY